MPVWSYQAAQLIGYIRKRDIGPYESNRDIHRSLRGVLRPGRQYCRQSLLDPGLTVHHVTADADKSGVPGVHARSSSTGSAAKALGVNQSTVQRRLRALEAALDCSLAERQAGGYRLTPHGQQLLAYAEQVETTVSTLQRQSATLDNRATGLVKLTSHVTVGQRIIKSGFLDSFHSEH